MEQVTFRRYDAADHLETGDEIAGYLGAVVEDAGDDPALVSRALGAVARARTMTQLSRDTGITREVLSKALSGEGDPSFDTIMKVARALGLRLKFEPASPPHKRWSCTFVRNAMTEPGGRGDHTRLRLSLRSRNAMSTGMPKAEKSAVMPLSLVTAHTAGT
jgi:probable addiction module antidote protein